MDEATPEPIKQPKRFRRKFGQPSGRKPTSPRRKPIHLSQARMHKLRVAQLGLGALIHGQPFVDRVISEAMALEKLKQEGDKARAALTETDAKEVAKPAE